MATTDRHRTESANVTREGEQKGRPGFPKRPEVQGGNAPRGCGRGIREFHGGDRFRHCFTPQAVIWVRSQMQPRIGSHCAARTET